MDGRRASTDLVITEEQLALLAGKVRAPRSVLSPFIALQKKYGNGGTPSGLPGAFVDGEGTLRPSAAAALAILAAARSFGSISFAGRGLAFESSVYFAGDEAETGVSLTNRGAELRLQSPPKAEAAVAMLGLQTGESLLRRIDVEAELSLEDGAVFFGCLDAVRRRELSFILHGGGGGSYRVSHVEEALEAAADGMQWLAPLYRRCTVVPLRGGKCVRDSLTVLLKKGLVKKDRGGWKPAPLLRQAAAELLLIDAHARLRQATVGKGGEASASDLCMVQGRSGAFLVWTSDASAVSLAGASAAQVTMLARDAMGPRRPVRE